CGSPPLSHFTAQATTPITTLSLPAALPISPSSLSLDDPTTCTATVTDTDSGTNSHPSGTVSFSSSGSGSFSSAGTCTLAATATRSEEHTSDLQSRGQLVCRTLLENNSGDAK